jgi:hypothetical protein
VNEPRLGCSVELSGARPRLWLALHRSNQAFHDARASRSFDGREPSPDLDNDLLVGEACVCEQQDSRPPDSIRADATPRDQVLQARPFVFSELDDVALHGAALADPVATGQLSPLASGLTGY